MDYLKHFAILLHFLLFLLFIVYCRFSYHFWQGIWMHTKNLLANTGSSQGQDVFNKTNSTRIPSTDRRKTADNIRITQRHEDKPMYTWCNLKFMLSCYGGLSLTDKWGKLLMSSVWPGWQRSVVDSGKHQGLQDFTIIHLTLVKLHHFMLVYRDGQSIESIYNL